MHNIRYSYCVCIIIVLYVCYNCAIVVLLCAIIVLLKLCIRQLCIIIIKLTHACIAILISQKYNNLGPQCGTAESIFSKMNEVMETHHIPWTNCVGIGVDNTSVNLGKNNSIMTRVRQENSSSYFMGCPCHIVHNMALKASESFTEVSHNPTAHALL